ncbi:hypothetical protein [Aquimarina aquimarini]|uniref:hypothetical protein n=1 Tax=Aquimarina aquimarini TaxID=1191734 RepID=UPI000D54EF57|nr:hypothetical protein [Aquimarina aquimarini]
MKSKFQIKLLFIVLIFASIGSRAQEQSQENKLSVKLSGFVWSETIFDTRQTVSARDADVILYPKEEVLDAYGKDINDASSFNMISIHSRAALRITAPDFLNAKVSGLIEGDFVGTSNDKIGLFRLRHAMVKLNWRKTELLSGFYWHPMFPVEVFPQVVSWGGAAPFHVLSRNPQVRFSYMPNSSTRFSITALSQLDFKSNGPNGVSTEYIRNAGIPEMNVQYVTGLNKNLLFGVTAGYKWLKPALSFTNPNETVVKTDQKVGSYHFNAFTKVNLHGNFLRAGAIYGQNMFNFLMIGGYAVENITDSKIDYTNIATGSYWTDFTLKPIKEKYTFGIYAGYSKNYGADATINGDIYARGTNIDYMYRVAPRLVYGKGKFKVRGEVMYNAAAYGTPDASLNFTNSNEVANVRFLLATTLHF